MGEEKFPQNLDVFLSDAYPKTLFCFQIYNKDWLDSPWSGFFEGKDPLKVADTGCQEETLNHIGKRWFMMRIKL